MSICDILNSAANIPQAFFDLAQRCPEKTVYSYPIIDPDIDCDQIPRKWHSVSYQETRERILIISDYLNSIGIISGKKVAILSNTRPEWMEADLAILSLGAVVVSLYQSLTPADIGYILADSGAEAIFAENEEQVNKILEVISKPVEVAATEDRQHTQIQLKIRKIISIERTAVHPLVISLSDIFESGKGRMKGLPSAVQSITRSDLASLVYTSGTTGPAKGVMQTHGNHLANVRQAFEGELCRTGMSIFLFLPLAHSFAKLMGYIGFLGEVQLKIAGVPDKRTSKMHPNSITKDMREANANLVPIVPRILEKMQAAVAARSKGSGVQAKMLRAVLSCGARLESCANENRICSLIDGIIWALTGFIRSKVKRRLFGDNFCYAISGGAKLSVDVARFFKSLDIEVLEGYGLTETCVATNVNRTGAVKIGSVGPVLAGDIEMKIAPDGEILFRGPNISLGYLNRPTATKQSWDSEGWFHTGDTGSVDSDGYLRIEGRKKELIVTSGGKKIAPEMIEQKLKSSEYISQAVLFGEGRNYCVALIGIEREAVEEWLRKNNKEIKDFSSDPDVKKLIEREVEKVNTQLASFESVKRIALLPEELTIENGLLTPTLKVKRKELFKRYVNLIANLYSGNDA